MSTRIKFLYDNNPKISMSEATYGVARKNFYDKDNRQLTLFIHFKDFYFEIMDKEANIIKKGGKTMNRAVLLRQAKRELVKLGCDFKQEVRHRADQQETEVTETESV